MSAGSVAEDRFGFAHEALVYAGTADFLAATVPFVADAVDRAEPVLVALPRTRGAMLQGALGVRAAEVRFVVMEEIGRNPAGIIPAWRAFVDARPGDGRPVRGIGEPIWAGRSPAEMAECHLHESLLNEAFSDTADFTLLCPYDATTLDPATLEEAGHTHPVLHRNGRRSASGRFAAADVRDRRFHASLPEPAPDTEVLTMRGERLEGDLHRMREQVSRHAARCGLGAERADDLVLAVDEVVVNAQRHGGGDATLRMWREGDRAVCEVRDGGELADAMAGRVRPGPVSSGGRGLWIVNQLCDLVQVRSTAGGTVVRLQVGPGPAQPSADPPSWGPCRGA